MFFLFSLCVCFAQLFEWFIWIRSFRRGPVSTCRSCRRCPYQRVDQFRTSGIYPRIRNDLSLAVSDFRVFRRPRPFGCGGLYFMKFSLDFAGCIIVQTGFTV